jgi:uncharacterized protein (TIGR02466 family)|tara:strand:+ start:112 stop:753 length:642 start_codon:yes stop_codon:yes gene_type:complete
MTKQATLQGLFGEPIYESNIERPYTKEELTFFEDSKKHVLKNEGKEGNSWTGKNEKGMYILELEKLSNLKKDIMEHVNAYFEQVYSPANDCSIYITQSWINYTEEKQLHHIHSHANSLVSGVVYLDADIDFDSITFYKREIDQTIRILPKEWNQFNSFEWNFPMKTGNIVLFPSNLKHGVKQKEGKNIRASLAFNTFVKGVLGKTEDATELRL